MMSFRCGRVFESTFVQHTAATEKHKWEALKYAPKIGLSNVWVNS